MGNQQVSPNLNSIPNFPDYFVDADGFIYSNKRREPRMLTHSHHFGKSAKPYIRVKIGGGTKLAHRLVVAATLGRPLAPHEFVNHKNADTTDNHPSNLEVVTHAQNVKHAVANKLYCSGAKWREARGLD